jgi:hypothetical protein
MRTGRVQYLFISTACVALISGAPFTTGSTIERSTEGIGVIDSSASFAVEVRESDLESSTVLVSHSARFAQLAKAWREKTRYSSSLRQHTMQPEYWDIIKMDRVALPFIFEEMKGSRWADWLFALRVITCDMTGAPKLAPETKLSDVRNAWLQWAVNKDYLVA